MIKIEKSNRKEIKDFNLREWHKVNFEHYGGPVDWKEEELVLKATEDGEIVGTMILKHESGVVYIRAIIVASEKRASGIGNMLMKKAEDFAKAKQAHKLHLITGKDWKARDFYEKLGFHFVAELPQHHFKRDFVIYEKFV